MSIRPYGTFDKSGGTFRTERLSAVTDKIITLGDRSHLKCGTHNDRLYNGSWLVGICHAEIAPHSVQCFHSFLIAHGIDLALGIHIGKISRIIQIITVTAVHCHDLSGLRIFDDNAYILGSHLFFECIYIFFYDLLKSQIQRSLNALAVCRFDDGLLHVGIIIDISVLPSIHTGKGCIVVAFQPGICHVSGKCKSDGVTGSLIKRIRSEIIFLKPHACDLGTFFQLCGSQLAVISRIFVFLECFFVIHGDLFLYDLILALLCGIIGEKFPHLILVKSQNFYKSLNGRLHRILILIDLQAVKDHIVNLVAGSQDVSVSVINVSSLGGECLIFIFLLSLTQHLFSVFASACGVDIGNSCHQTD